MDREKSVETNVSELKDTASIIEFEQKNNDLIGRAPTSVRIPTNTTKQPMILTAFPQTTPPAINQAIPSNPFQVTQQVMKEEEKVEEGTEKVEDGIEQEEEGEATVEEGEEQEEEQEGDQEQVERDDEQEQLKQDEEQVEEQTSDQEQAPEQDTDADNYTQQPRKSVRRNKLLLFHSFHIDFLPNNLHRNQSSQL